ncbi:GNAT family N-acetyltransferase [Burkholderiaceae bacterium DAT-1]|nr:GNAT family N-acetyltransferase [Burkholderiaceae bacterium DAT-1]
MTELLPLPDSPDSRDAIRHLYDNAPGYFRAVYGRAWSEEEVIDLFEACPPAVARTRKHVFGIYDAAKLVGVVDLLQGFPDDQTCYIGLLLLAESHQGKGLGTRVLTQICTQASHWQLSQLRLAVIETNLPALNFWRRAGFVRQDRKPIVGCIADALVMTRPLITKID